MTAGLNSPVGYLRLLWAKPNSNEYTKAIEVINDCYRKILMIGKSKEVFQDKVPDLLKAKTYNDFTLAKDNIALRYDRYLKLVGIKLNFGKRVVKYQCCTILILVVVMATMLMY
jgi:hypothetical protein